MTGEPASPVPYDRPPLELDTSVAHPARVYDYWLGGKDNFAADREAAESVIAVRPSIISDIRANRSWLGRSVRYLTAEAGIRQFLDIGTGIPTKNNTHEVAQSIAPESRIVYVDNDPIVLVHARSLLTSTSEGATAYIDADLRDPDEILRVAAETLDFSRPIAVMLIGIMHLISDAEDPYALVSRLVDAVPAGSALALSHPASDIHAEVVARGAHNYNQRVSTPQTRRSRDEVARFFDRLELVPPGVVQADQWRPDLGTEDLGQDPSLHVAVGRKP